MEELGGWKRSCYCAELGKKDAGQKVCLMGWVNSYRDHGGVVFIDLRDRTGLVQVVFNPSFEPATHEKAGMLRNEWVVAVQGEVRARPADGINPKLKTGEIEVWASTEVDAVAFGDSWAGPEGLGISLDVWRDLFKPLYRQYCDLLRRGDKFAFFRAGGDVTPVLDELIEIGVDAVHCPLHLLPLETVVQRWRDRVTFWIGLDNPRMVVDGPREAIRQAVQRVQAAFEPHRGGLVVHCPWPPQAPFDHVAAMLEQWLAPPHPHPCHARRIR